MESDEKSALPSTDSLIFDNIVVLPPADDIYAGTAIRTIATISKKTAAIIISDSFKGLIFFFSVCFCFSIFPVLKI
jgi:hypothetical protein